MPTTKVTNNVLADNAALNNLNAGASIAFTKSVSVTGNFTVDTNTFFVDTITLLEMCKDFYRANIP